MKSMTTQLKHKIVESYCIVLLQEVLLHVALNKKILQDGQSSISARMHVQ